MVKPDFSGLNETQRQEMMLELLFDNKALLTTLLGRAADDMQPRFSMDYEQAEEFLLEAFREAKRADLADYGVPFTDTKDQNDESAPDEGGLA